MVFNATMSRVRTSLKKWGSRRAVKVGRAPKKMLKPKTKTDSKSVIQKQIMQKKKSCLTTTRIKKAKRKKNIIESMHNITMLCMVESGPCCSLLPHAVITRCGCTTVDNRQDSHILWLKTTSKPVSTTRIRTEKLSSKTTGTRWWKRLRWCKRCNKPETDLDPSLRVKNKRRRTIIAKKNSLSRKVEEEQIGTCKLKRRAKLV